MDEKRLAEIKQRAEAATVGPWIYDDGPQHVRSADYQLHIADIPEEEGELVADIRGYGAGLPQMANGEFIAHARQDVPDLLAKIEQLQAKITLLQDMDKGQSGVIGDLSDRVMQLEDDLATARQDRDRFSNLIVHRGMELENQQCAIDRLQFENSELRARLQRLTEAIEIALGDLDAATTGKQYDPSWGYPQTLPTKEIRSRAEQAFHWLKRAATNYNDEVAELDSDGQPESSAFEPPATANPNNINTDDNTSHQNPSANDGQPAAQPPVDTVTIPTAHLESLKAIARATNVYINGGCCDEHDRTLWNQINDELLKWTDDSLTEMRQQAGEGGE